MATQRRGKVFRGRIPKGSVPADSKILTIQGKTCFFLTFYIVFIFISLRDYQFKYYVNVFVFFAFSGVGGGMIGSA